MIPARAAAYCRSLLKLYAVTFISLCIVFPGCKEAADFDPDKVDPPKFHNTHDEGYWRGKADSHIPIITISADDPRVIEVGVPLKQTLKPLHYIEVIALVKNGRQIDAHKLSPVKTSPVVTFTLPDTDYKSYSVVVKCNLHDMWRAPVQRESP